MALNISQNSIQGRVAIGEKKISQNGKTYPAKLDYFVFTKPYDPKADIAPKYPEMEKVIKNKYNTDKPKKIEVTLVGYHPDEVFFTDYLNYPGKSCDCRGDGEWAIRTVGENKEKIKCDYEKCTHRQKKTANGIITTCKPTGVLTFMMPESPVAGGLWKFTTHSNMSIGKIMQSLRNICSIRGSLFGLKINLKVVVVPMTVMGKLQNIPTVEVELPFSWDELASGAGTSIGTLMDAKAKHLSINHVERIEKIAEIATKEQIPEIDEKPQDDVPADIPQSNNESSNDDEFQF